MGFISRKVLPACVCCPSLNPSSRRPVKRYKKLLAEIFQKNVDVHPNERKIMKLCEYAAKNTIRIPKIAKFLEQKSHKELRNEHTNTVKTITEIYSKLLFTCKEQMAYFAISLLRVIAELVDAKQQNDIQILGCITLTRFIYSQGDNTFSRNIEGLVHKVCLIAREHGEGKSVLRASSLQCLSSMIWFMSQYSYIFSEIDKIIHVILENYQNPEDNNNDEISELHHNWVDEVVRGETRNGLAITNDVNPSNVVIWPRLEAKDSALLTREERESPKIWSRICMQKLVELACESATMRLILEPMFIYFDNGRHWASQNGLALLVLSDISYSARNSGNEQIVLAAIIRHLDNTNVVNIPQTKSDIIQVATSFVREIRSRIKIGEVGLISDLCRHLRKTLQATVQYGFQESNWNDSLQNSLEDCLLEIIRGITFDVNPGIQKATGLLDIFFLHLVADEHLIFDMMAITLEKLPDSAVVARATIGSLLIVAHMASLTLINSHSQVFPEALLVQLLKAMMHSDVETRTGAHQLFAIILGRTPDHPGYESEYLFETKKWQSRTTSIFASATALLEKLRKEKEGLNTDKQTTGLHVHNKLRHLEESSKHTWVEKFLPYFSKITSSVIDRIANSIDLTDKDVSITNLSEDQIAQLFSAFWIQAHRADNKPLDYVAISHSFSLTILVSCHKSSRRRTMGQAFQLLLSLKNVSLDLNGMMPPPCQRSLFTLSMGLLAFIEGVYHISGLSTILKFNEFFEVDPYLGVGEDFQIYVRSQSDIDYYGSESDQQAAKSMIADLRSKVGDCDQALVDVLIQEISSLTGSEKDILAKQLTETFVPEDVSLFGITPSFNWVGLEAEAISEESVSFDEECSRTSSIDGDSVKRLPSNDVTRVISTLPEAPSPSNVISVGQLLESALHVAGQVAGASVSTSPLPYGKMASQCEAFGVGTRNKLLTGWLDDSHGATPGCPSPIILTNEPSSVRRSCGFEQASAPAQPWLALRLPPSSAFDNFMRAAGGC